MRQVLLIPVVVMCAWAQSQPDGNVRRGHGRGAAKEMASGAGDLGLGAAKGAGNLAKGAGRGVVDLATLHPINAAASLGRGAGAAAKDAGVGALKGTAKIGLGVGKAFKKLF